MPRPPDSDFKGVLIALAGPTFGLLAAVPFFLAARQTGDPPGSAAPSSSAVINLLNLAPAPPLDGSKALGPALARIHPLVERAALVIVGRRGGVLGPAAPATGSSAPSSASPPWALVPARTLRSPARPLSGAEWVGQRRALAGGAAFCCGGVARRRS